MSGQIVNPFEIEKKKLSFIFVIKEIKLNIGFSSLMLIPVLGSDMNIQTSL